MRRKGLFLVLLVLLVVVPVAQVMAQGDITLEDLADQLAALVERMEAIESQLDFTPPVDQDGNCRLALRNRVHPQSMVAYLETYPDNRSPEYIYIIEVQEGEDGTLITFHTYERGQKDKNVIETWDGCEFVGHSDWWEED